MSDFLRKQIFDECPDIKIYTKDNIELELTSVDVDTTGLYVMAHTENGETIFTSELKVYTHFLPVPGIGYLRPGTNIRMDNDDNKYVLRFGWHTNISNQTIYSWYLEPITQVIVDKVNSDEYMSKPQKELSEARTLYYDMIDHINLVEV